MVRPRARPAVTGWEPEELEQFRYDPCTGIARGAPWELPHPITTLESKALLADLEPSVLRDWLRGEVERRRALAFRKSFPEASDEHETQSTG